MWYGENWPLSALVEKALGVELSRVEKQVLHYRLGWGAEDVFLTQQEVAEELGLSQPYISKVERDVKRLLKRAIGERDG